MAQLAAKQGSTITTVQRRIEELTFDGPAVVILAVDCMEARKAIWESSVRYNPSVRMLETRMAAEYGIVHTIDPINPAEVQLWEDSWFPSSEAEASACTNRAVATTARSLAAIVVHNLIAWEAGDKPPAYTFFALRPLTIQTRAA